MRERAPQSLEADISRRPPATLAVVLGQVIVWTVVALVLTGLLAVVVPRFEEMFRGSKVAVPQATVYLIRTARWFSADLGWVYVWLLPVMVPMTAYILIGRARVEARRRRWAVWRGIIMLVLFAIVAFFIVTLYMPLVALLQTLTDA